MTRHLGPAEIRPARLAALPKLPIFLDLSDRRVVVAGGGEPVAWKAELLAAAGATVVVHAADPAPELDALAAAGSVCLVRRPWREADLDGAWLAVADLHEADEAERFAAAARRRGVLVNLIDQPAFCDFQFGTIVNRAPVVVAINTDGAAPILGQAIRRRIEAVLPNSLGTWARAAKSFRDRLKDLLPGKADRRRFWEMFVDVAFTSQAREDEELADLERLARSILTEPPQKPAMGEVVIVGGGPGDPELVTLKAMRELQAADVIVYDRLVTPGVLELARREAQRIHVGKTGHGPACRQDDISALLVELASAGKRVVRLKGGDPAIFGRTGEEAEICRAAGVPVRIVPGITTASAAAASLGLSLTHRDHAQRVQFVTGHDRNGALPPDLDLDALADPRSTTAVYMGRRTAGQLARALIERGLGADTPALVLTNVSRRDEEHRQGTLGDLAMRPLGVEDAPTLLLIGAALQVRDAAAAAVADGGEALRVLAPA